VEGVEELAGVNGCVLEAPPCLPYLRADKRLVELLKEGFKSAVEEGVHLLAEARDVIYVRTECARKLFCLVL
jgi:hypothetical protein